MRIWRVTRTYLSRRQEHRARGMALHAARNTAGAREAFVRSVDVTPHMAYELIKLLRAERIPYVVAPYEADAQLAFLEREGIIDGIITEDSDLLVFGCRTVLFKLDTYGSCVEIQRDRFASARQLSLAGWGTSEFRQMAILSGCDYLPSIVGMGLKNAHRLLRRYESVERVLQALRLDGKMHVPPSYASDFCRAEFTFVHQRVWDPRGDGCMATLAPLPKDAAADLIEYIGAPIEHDEARRIARGDLCPITRRPFTAVLLPTQPRQAQQPTLQAFFSGSAPVRRDAMRIASAPARMSTPTRATQRGLFGHCVSDEAAAAVATNQTAAASDTNTKASISTTYEATVLNDLSVTTADTSRPDSSRDTLHDSSCSADTLFEADLGTPPTSPDPSPLAAPKTPRHSDIDVSSPVSSPVGSPPRAMLSTPLPRRGSTPRSSRRVQSGPALALQARSDDGADDEARRASWIQRFSFSGPRPRHIVLPGTSPRTPEPRAAQLHMEHRETCCASPALTLATPLTGEKRPLSHDRSRPTPAKRSVSATTSLATSTTPPPKRVHSETCDTPGSGSAKLLQFQYRRS